jgi:AGZA family xanthine/uracil permease-like MFS transporter
MTTQKFHYNWAAKGDLNAFFALMLDNMMNLVILTAILTGFGYPSEYVFKYMIPGTALGVLIGDLVYSYMAVRLARKAGRDDVTAMPLGLDTPSTIGITLIVLVPVWLETKDPMTTWQVGMATTFCIGIVKLGCSFIGDWIRKTVPPAGLIGSLAGVGIALLAFLPLMHIFSAPIVGLIALAFIFYTLVAAKKLPFGTPGAFAAVIVGTVLWHVLGHYGLVENYHGLSFKLSYGFPLPTLGFLYGIGKAINYLPVAIPFGILTIVGGINVTESAMLAGDKYKTRDILLTEAISTIIAGMCGGLSQSTPYIGHPAFKKMGAKAAYTLATGLFIGIGGCLGYIQFIVDLIPVASVAPILVYIGLEILDQGYHDCPQRHASAVGFALLPCVAELIRIVVSGQLHIDASVISSLPEVFRGEALRTFGVINLLGHGFILTAMLWGAAVAHLIDGKIKYSALYFYICAVFTAFGLIHSASPTGGLYLPWNAPDAMAYQFSVGYVLMATLLIVLSFHHKRRVAASA